MIAFMKEHLKSVDEDFNTCQFAKKYLRCNFSCNLQRNSTLKRCKFVTNVWYVKNILASCDGNLYLPILHCPRVELHCKLQEKLHHVTGPL